MTSSDHTPLWLNLTFQPRYANTPRFRFENAWTREPFCRQIVADEWQKYKDAPLVQKLSGCQSELEKWGRAITSRFSDRIQAYKQLMHWVKGGRDKESIRVYKETHGKLSDILSHKELFPPQEI